MNVLSKKPLISILAASTIATIGGNVYAQGGYDLTLEEIVVTAQKREENYLSVPLTVNAFTAQDMKNTGAITIQDIDDFMPGVETGDTVGGTTQSGITIRGVATVGISSGQDPSVATFYDGSYMPRAATTVPFSDLERIEVLKGPQGTLFGRNATAGVVNIVPIKPSDEFEGFVAARVGNYDLYRVEGMVNVPITDSLAVRANVLSHHREGTVDNIGIGEDAREEGFAAARVSALWDLSDETSLQFSFDIEDRDEQPRQTVGVGKYAHGTEEQRNNPFAGPVTLDVESAEETRDMYGVGVKLNHQINSEMDVFAVLSYRDWETTNLQDEDGTSDKRRYFDTNNIEESNILYSEVRFSFVNDKINFIAGANYSTEDVYQRTDLHISTEAYMQFVTIGAGFGQDDHLWDLLGDADATYLNFSNAFGVGLLPPRFAGQFITETMDNTGTFENWGVFADAGYQITDAWRLTAGLRYSNDDKEYSWQTFDRGVDWPVAPDYLSYNPSVTGADEADYLNRFDAAQSWSKTTGRLVLDWAFSDNAMMYLSYATGYKSGGFDGQSFSGFVAGPFSPEDVTSIEWGLKGDFFNQRVRAEFAVFDQEIEGLQLQVDTKDSPEDTTAAPTVISADSQTRGVELIVQWNALDDLRLTAMSTYRDKEEQRERYFNAAGDAAGGVNKKEHGNVEYTLRVDWTPPVAVGSMLVHVDYVFKDDAGPDVDTAIFATGPWYYKNEKNLSARVAWQNNDETIELAVWGKNLLDQQRASNPGGLVADALGAAHTTLSDPRTFGVDMRYSF